MQLTRFTDLGLRIVSELALEHTKATTTGAAHPRVTTASVSESIGASQTHVAKVVSRLSELGVVHSTRGRTGGIVLAPAALSYSLGALVRRLEGADPVVSPIHGDSRPTNQPYSPLYQALHAAERAFFRELNTRTIRDIVPRLEETDGAHTSGMGLAAAAIGSPELNLRPQGGHRPMAH